MTDEEDIFKGPALIRLIKMGINQFPVNRFVCTDLHKTGTIAVDELDHSTSFQIWSSNIKREYKYSSKIIFYSSKLFEFQCFLEIFIQYIQEIKTKFFFRTTNYSVTMHTIIPSNDFCNLQIELFFLFQRTHWLYFNLVHRSKDTRGNFLGSFF